MVHLVDACQTTGKLPLLFIVYTSMLEAGRWFTGILSRPTALSIDLDTVVVASSTDAVSFKLDDLKLKVTDTPDAIIMLLSCFRDLLTFGVL